MSAYFNVHVETDAVFCKLLKCTLCCHSLSCIPRPFRLSFFISFKFNLSAHVFVVGFGEFEFLCSDNDVVVVASVYRHF